MTVRALYSLLKSPGLAIALLVAILVSCIVGAAALQEERAAELIFSAPWFNALLVGLVVNVAFCFFSRTWRRKLTLVSAGMNLFHLSFVAMFLGIALNSLTSFRGTLRLSEGETLPNSAVESYDIQTHGRLFDFSWLKGSTTLDRVRPGFTLEGANKYVAYEVSLLDPGVNPQKQADLVYVTHPLSYAGTQYFRDREGYTVLVILYDAQGREVFGAFVPLQSMKQDDGSYLYTTGSRDGAGPVLFPHGDSRPLFLLEVFYQPDARVERIGEVSFHLWGLPPPGSDRLDAPLASGNGTVGQTIALGDYHLAVTEVRYWAAMDVRHDPGHPIVLGSLWVGLGGMLTTFVGRLLRRPRSERPAVGHSDVLPT